MQTNPVGEDPIDGVSDAVAAAAFRRLVAHLRHRDDAQNVDIMGLAGFCRNCLGDWVAEASDGTIDREAGRAAVYGMPYADWKAAHQQPATPEQIARMEQSLKLNPRGWPVLAPPLQGRGWGEAGIFNAAT